MFQKCMGDLVSETYMSLLWLSYESRAGGLLQTQILSLLRCLEQNTIQMTTFSVPRYGQIRVLFGETSWQLRISLNKGWDVE